MKTKILFTLFFTIALISCEDYLERNPLDEIVTESFWTTPSDLEIYLNHFYTSFTPYPQQEGSAYICDGGSDNLVHGSFYPKIGGTATVPASGGGWDWGNIRSINYFLINYHKVDAQWDNIRHYVGEAHFFRAYYYFEKVMAFGDVPWINEPLTPESEELYSERISRNVVVDSIIGDLDKAISLMKSKGEIVYSRLNKQAALAFKSRVCLFEGTWEKYHAGTPFGVSGSDGTKYLALARNAAKELINGESLQLYSTGRPNNDYYELFGQTDYRDNPEVIFWREYNNDLGLYHRENGTYYRGQTFGLSKWLVDDYLCIDGLPISKSPFYAGDNNLLDVVKNRDPRLPQIMWNPGDPTIIENGDTSRFEKPLIDQFGEYLCSTGYQMRKYSDNFGANLTKEFAYINDVGYILFRYAEVLLNYAEARVELGEITQSDIDMTINKLRDRVGVAHLQLTNIVTDPNWRFPNLSPIVNEVRRERRVELALEHLRLFDLLRWRAHDLFVNKRPLGAKFIQEDFPSLEVGENIFVDENGYIDFWKNALPSGFQFKPNRDYLDPVPSKELTLNPDLTQNPNW